MQPRFKALTQKKKDEWQRGRQTFFAMELPHFPTFPQLPKLFPIAPSEVISIFDGVFRLNNFWCEFPKWLKAGIAIGLSTLGQ